MKFKYLLSFVLIVFAARVSGQKLSQNYLELQNKLARGWNTWSYESMLNHVLLPEGLSIKLNFRQAFIATPRDPLLVLDRLSPDTTGLVSPIAHGYDGSYTELIINEWHGNTIKVQSTTVGDDVFILVRPIKSDGAQYQVDVLTGFIWNKPGNVFRQGDVMFAKSGNREIPIRTTRETIESYHPYASPYFSIKGGEAFAIYTGAARKLSEIEGIISQAQKKHNEYAVNKFGELSDAYLGIQSVLGWNTLYDAKNNRVLSPVTRGWNEAWQGYVLFNWDTYFASYLFALDSKELAYSNALAVTKWPNANGNIGHYQMADGTVSLMSQPPIGSTVIWKIYEKYQEKWFLEEVYNELLTWNNWWVKNRLNGEYLTWGGWKGANAQIAAWESGLDNSPMYDGIDMVETENASLLDLADVGLMSMYALDCQSIAKMASVLGKKSDEKELLARARKYSALTQKLWNEELGIFNNKRIKAGTFNTRLSPTLFYPMISNIASKKQAKRMLEEHYLNEEEFYGKYIIPSIPRNDPDYNGWYWRGAIWAPMNYIVYMGLKNYDQELAKEMSNKSYDLFMEQWINLNAVLENVNADKGGASYKYQENADAFYHWGALIALMRFEEEGWMKNKKE